MQDAANLAEFDVEVEISMGGVSEAGTQQNPIPTNTFHPSDGPKDLSIQPQWTYRRYTGMAPRKPWLDDDEDDAATDHVRHRVPGLPSTSRGIEGKRQKSLGRDQPHSFKQKSVPVETDVRSKGRGSLWKRPNAGHVLLSGSSRRKNRKIIGICRCFRWKRGLSSTLYSTKTFTERRRGAMQP